MAMWCQRSLWNDAEGQSIDTVILAKPLQPNRLGPSHWQRGRAGVSLKAVQSTVMTCRLVLLSVMSLTIQNQKSMIRLKIFNINSWHPPLQCHPLDKLFVEPGYKYIYKGSKKEKKCSWNTQWYYFCSKPWVDTHGNLSVFRWKSLWP